MVNETIILECILFKIESDERYKFDNCEDIGNIITNIEKNTNTERDEIIELIKKLDKLLM